MTVDTQLWAKGLPIVGNGFGFVADLTKKVGGAIPGAKEIAWRMTASALKNSIKDMYQGQLVVMGDPSVKPYDRIWIHDIYENMQGQCSVEAVVHSFNAQSGFTTTIYPDCISAVDDTYERYNDQMMRSVLATVGTYAAFAGMSYWSGHNQIWKTELKLGKLIAKGGTSLTKHVKNLAAIYDKDASKLNSKILSITNRFSSPLQASTGIAYYDSLVDQYTHLDKFLSKRTIDGSLDDAINFLKKNGEALQGADPRDVSKILINLTSEPLPSNVTVAFGNYGTVFDNAISDTFKLDSAFYTKLDDLATLLEGATENADDLKDSVKFLRTISQNQKISNAKEMVQLGEALQKSKLVESTADILHDITTGLDTIKDLAKVTDTARDSIKILDNAKGFFKTILTAAGPWGIIVGIASFVIETVVSAVIGAYVTENVERYLQNLQVLQIYPLTKNGYVMTAGLVGHKGLVVGSPTENQQGEWTKWVTDLFGGKAPTGFLSGFVQTFITNDRIRKICSKYRVTNQKVDPLSSTFNVEKMTSDMIESMSKVYAKYALQDEKSIFKVNRYQTIEESYTHAKEYLITSDTTNPVLSAKAQKELVPVVCDAILKGYLEKGVLLLSNDMTKDTIVTGTFNGEQVELPCRFKNGYYNVPILRPEAIIILREICTTYCVYAKFNTEMEDLKKAIQENALVLTSATIINDPSYEGTGYTFRLNTNTNGENPTLDAAVDKVYKTYCTKTEDGTEKINAFFKHYNTKTYEHIILISVPVN